MGPCRNRYLQVGKKQDYLYVCLVLNESTNTVRTMWFLHILHFYYRVMYCMGLVIGGLSENISTLFLYKVNGVKYSLIYGYGE